MWVDIKAYLLLKTIQFMRWLDMPDQYWTWLDQNIFNGVL